MKPEKTKRFLLFCEPCAYRKIFDTDKPEGLYLSKSSAVPLKTIKMGDDVDKSKSFKEQPIKSKCPKCGRGVILKKLPQVYAKSYDEVDKRKQKEQEEYEKKKRIEDGTPKKLTPPDFMG